MTAPQFLDPSLPSSLGNILVPIVPADTLYLAKVLYIYLAFGAMSYFLRVLYNIYIYILLRSRQAPQARI